MRPWLNLLLLAFFFLGSCAPAYPFLSTVEVSQTPQTVLPLSTPTPLPSPTPTFTPSPTATPAPTPTDTPLPPLVPPTLEPLAPARAIWQGEPVYQEESRPGYLFQIEYMTAEWGLSVDYNGQPALVHRTLPGCYIVTTVPRGLPPAAHVETLSMTFGNVSFEVNIVRNDQGKIESAILTGGDGTITTAFQVETGQNAEACLEAVESLLSTLKSIPQP
jgi:hypothetical protein